MLVHLSNVILYHIGSVLCDFNNLYFSLNEEIRSVWIIYVLIKPRWKVKLIIWVVKQTNDPKTCGGPMHMKKKIYCIYIVKKV